MSSNRLTVAAADVAAEISVLDGSFERVAHGVGRLDQDLAPGLYKVRVRIGPSVEEQLVSLDQDRVVTIDPPEFPSPIPLLGTSKTHEYHIAAAVETSSTAQDRFGDGGSIFVFAREWTGRQGEESKSGNPAEGLSLLREIDADVETALVPSLAMRADVRTDGDACAGWRGDVAPGPYRLRLALTDGTASERAIFVAPGQQTQVFLVRADYQLLDGRTERRANLSGGAVVISLSQTFNPDDRRTRLAELARYALTQSRRVLSEVMLEEILDEKTSEPMLGLLGAHLLLRDEPDDRQSFDRVIANLLRLLGPEHPDVLALRLRSSTPPVGDDACLLSPPMLRASWDIAVGESQRSPEIFPSEAPCSAIATRILPSAPWLMWRTGSSAGGTDDRTDVILDIIGDYLKARAGTDMSLRQIRARRSSVIGILETLGSTLSTAKAGVLHGLDALGWIKDPADKSELSQVLGLPAYVLENMLKSLDPKDKSDLSQALGLPSHVLENILKRLQR